MKLEAETVEKIFKDCLYKEEEVPEDGSLPDGVVKVEGIMHDFGFHHTRLESHRQEVRELVDQLSDTFRRDVGGGWSFLQACVDKRGYHWGEHPSMEMLVCLGVGLGMVEYLMPKTMWSLFPGSMPYIVVNP